MFTVILHCTAVWNVIIYKGTVTLPVIPLYINVNPISKHLLVSALWNLKYTIVKTLWILLCCPQTLVMVCRNFSGWSDS